MIILCFKVHYVLIRFTYYLGHHSTFVGIIYRGGEKKDRDLLDFASKQKEKGLVRRLFAVGGDKTASCVTLA